MVDLFIPNAIFYDNSLLFTNLYLNTIFLFSNEEYKYAISEYYYRIILIKIIYPLKIILNNLSIKLLSEIKNRRKIRFFKALNHFKTKKAH